MWVFGSCVAGVGVLVFDWEAIVVEDVVDDVEFAFMFLFLQVVVVKSVVQEFYCCVFVLCGVVGHVWDDGVCEG
jgi:hypothetical protein